MRAGPFLFVIVEVAIGKGGTGIKNSVGGGIDFEDSLDKERPLLLRRVGVKTAGDEDNGIFELMVMTEGSVRLGRPTRFGNFSETHSTISNIAGVFEIGTSGIFILVCLLLRCLEERRAGDEGGIKFVREDVTEEVSEVIDLRLWVIEHVRLGGRCFVVFVTVTGKGGVT